MKECNKLVRDNVAGLLKDKGYAIKGKKVKGEEYTFKLYSLFWQEFNESKQYSNPKYLQIHYADMLEAVRTLMLKNGLSLKDVESNETQPVKWYKNLVASPNRVKTATTDLLQKFYELLQIKTEAIKDQLIDIFNSFKQFVESNNVDFAQVEMVRRAQYDKLGGYNKGIYLEGVTIKRDYSINLNR